MEPVTSLTPVAQVHCVTDTVVYLPEMIAQPVFIFHHLILFVVSCIQPYCPGCIHLVTAYTIAELGSATIAVDAEWRKFGDCDRMHPLL